MSNAPTRIKNSRIMGYVIRSIALIGSLAGILSYLDSSVPKLRFEELSSTKLLNIGSNVNELEIRYRGVDLHQEEFNLSILKVKVLNNGTADIRQVDYDLNAPVGFIINQGVLLDQPKLVSEHTTSSYLMDHAMATVDSSHRKVALPNVIIGEGEYYTLQLLVLHHKDSTPSISPEGKIAGVKEIEVTKFSSDENPIVAKVKDSSLTTMIGLGVGASAFFAFVFILVISTIQELRDYKLKTDWIKANSNKYEEFIRSQLPNLSEYEIEMIVIDPDRLAATIWHRFSIPKYPDLALIGSLSGGIIWSVAMVVLCWSLIEFVLLLL